MDGAMEGPQLGRAVGDVLTRVCVRAAGRRVRAAGRRRAPLGRGPPV